MTTLAKAQMRDYEIGTQNELPVIASDIIYQGAAVGDNALGYVRPLVAGDAFRGFAIEDTDNSTGAAGDKKSKLYTEGKVVLTVVGASAVTDVGSSVYATDDNTFTLAPSTPASYIGTVFRWVSSTTCIVKLKGEETLGAVLTKTVALTTTEVKALFASPAELVAAPGAGKVIDLISAVLFLDYASATYDTQGVLTIQTGTTGTAQSDAIAAAAFLFKTADQFTGVQVLSAERTLDANESLVLSCGTANPATGDSPVTVKVSYRVLDFS